MPVAQQCGRSEVPWVDDGRMKKNSEDVGILKSLYYNSFRGDGRDLG
jgi:hypothetical protein